MTKESRAILTLHVKACRAARRVLHGRLRDKSGKRADLASDALWLLSDAITQTHAHLKRLPRHDPLSDFLNTGRLLMEANQQAVRELL